MPNLPHTTIWVRLAPESDGVLVSVDDDGPGVPEALRDRIFEPFSRGPDAPRHSPGVGIGLSLVGSVRRAPRGARLGGRAPRRRRLVQGVPARPRLLRPVLLLYRRSHQ